MSATLHIEVGKSYRTRDGSKATITRSGPNQKSWFGTVDGVTWAWHYNGRFADRYAAHPMDLVAEWVEPPAPQPLQFEVGKAYRTRDGRKAVILDFLDRDCDYPVIGAIEGEPKKDRWRLDGRWSNFPVDSGFRDLVAEWVEPTPQPTLKFEVGKAYRTRDGRKAVLRDISSTGVLVGKVYTGENSATIDWWANGRFTRDGNHTPLDLVAEWDEPASQPQDLTIEEMRAVDIEKTRKELEHTKALLKEAQQRIQALERAGDEMAKRIEDLCGGLTNIAGDLRYLKKGQP